MDLDPAKPEGFKGLEGQFDTVIALNVLESLEDPIATLRAAYSTLLPGGRIILQLPQCKKRFGTLDQERGRRTRFEADEVRKMMEDAAFRVESVADFNRMSVPGWLLNGKLLGRKRFSRLQLKVLDTVLPLMRRIEGIWPWKGLSLIAIGVK